jgi:putative transposase
VLRRRSPRLSSFDYRGHHRYFWTICTDQRRRLFVDPATVEQVGVHFLQASAAEKVAVLAYCFMPDHLHLLVEGLAEDANVDRFITRAKQASGYWFNRQHGGRLWQKTSWDRVLRRDEDTLTVIRYTLDNPVRAGIVAAGIDYPFSGSMVVTREELFDAAFGG